MRVHRVPVLLGAAAAVAACSYMSMGQGGIPESADDSGGSSSDGSGLVVDDGATEGGGVVVPGEDAACGPSTCPGCCLEGQCEPGTSIDVCGQGGVACTICGDDSGTVKDSGHDEDSGELDAGHDSGFDAGEKDAGHDAGFDAGEKDAGKDAATDAGHDAGLPFGAKCVASAQCGAVYPDCEAVPGITDGGMMCTKPCTKPTQDAGCPKPPTNGLCATVGYCE